MKSLNLKISALSVFTFIVSFGYCFAQQGNLVVNQDEKITTLLEVKKEMNKNELNSDRYQIQIYSANNRAGAYTTIKEFESFFSNWKAIDIYESPNFKVWVGNFNTRLEANKALIEIKEKFPAAFIFKPKK